MLMTRSEKADNTAKHRYSAYKLLGIAGLMLVSVFLVAEAAFSGKYLWLTRGSVNLGSLPQGASRQVRLWIINPTGRIVHLHPQATCGCTLPALGKKILLPVDATPMEVTVGTFGRRPGRYQERITITCQSGDTFWEEEIEVHFTVSASAPSQGGEKNA